MQDCSEASEVVCKQVACGAPSRNFQALKKLYAGKVLENALPAEPQRGKCYIHKLPIKGKAAVILGFKNNGSTAHAAYPPFEFNNVAGAYMRNTSSNLF